MRLAKVLLTLSIATGLFGFTIIKQDIPACFTDLNKAAGLTKVTVDRLPGTSEKVRQLQTDHGNVDVSRIDGYRIIYNNKKRAPFVNVKVELSDPSSYQKDTANMLDNLKYLNAQSQNMESKELIQLNYNGYVVYGLSRSSIDEGSTLGTFVLFPGNGTTVYIYFNNLKPELRNFKSLEEYKSKRNEFIGAYTDHLKQCLGR